MHDVFGELERECGDPFVTSLCEAIRRGDEETICEQSLHLEGLSTCRPKEEAVLAGRPDLLKLLLERDDAIEEYLVTTACERKDRESVRVLLDFGWPINHSVYSAASLLCTAVNDLAFMQWLVENGADVNARSRNDETVLSIAISEGDMDVVRYLCLQGTDITRGDLLHCAAQRKNQSEGAELVDYLAHQGAHVNAYRFDNNVALRWRGLKRLPTPLHVACERRNIPVARVLLQHGADPDRMMLEAGEPTHPTPLEEAQEIGDQELIGLLNGHGP